MDRRREKHPINDKDSHELLGFAVMDSAGWLAQTVFGYQIARTDNQAMAERVVRDEGQAYLRGIWQYLDTEDGQWYSCVIKDATELRVTVIRTNTMGFQEPETSRLVTIDEPSELNLQKIS